MEDNKKIKLAKIKLKKRNKIVIDTIENYVAEYNLKVPKKDISKFPDLFKVRLDKDQKNDIQSIVNVLEGSPAINLYASLLAAEQSKNEKNDKK